MSDPAAPTPLSPPAVPSDAVRHSQTLAVASVLGLIALGLAWELWLAPLRPGGSWVALKVLPLCLPLAGLLKNRLYTHRWLSLLLWLYFTEGVVRATSEAGLSQVLAATQVVLSLLLFAAVTWHVKARFKAAAAQANQAPQTA